MRKKSNINAPTGSGQAPHAKIAEAAEKSREEKASPCQSGIGGSGVYAERGAADDLHFHAGLAARSIVISVLRHNSD